MIQLEGIVKTYGTGPVKTPVLKNVSARIERGEYVAIMGASGTGKTTLMNILGCIDKPTSGRYLFDGEDMVGLDDEALSRLRNKKIGFVFQQFYMLDRASAAQNVLLPMIYAQEYPADIEQRARQLLTEVGLGERINYRPSELSGGQLQRVAIARALINDPAVIIADEPTGNLDSRSAIEILAIFQRLHRQGRTMVVVTHERSVAEHAQRVIVIKDGTVVEDRKIDTPLDAEAELQALIEKDKKACES